MQFEIDRTIVYGDVKLLVARDDAQRCFIGLSTGSRLRSDFVFLPVHPATIAEIEAHTVDLHTVIERRRLGPAVPVGRHEVLAAVAGKPSVGAWFGAIGRPLRRAEGRPR